VRLLRRLLTVGLILLIVVIVAAGGLLLWISHRALPATGGTLEASGLSAPVTISRDASGIINITAGTSHDLFLAQGYSHAQERFWQMEVWRHIGAGRLSELFGPTTLKEDEFIRTLGWRQAAQRDLDAASPELKADLRAYADGVNDWLKANQGQLGLAFVVEGLKAGLGGGLGGYTPEPWTPLDSATWALVQAWSLGDNFDSEVFRILADAKLGDPTRTNELTPPYPADGPVIAPSNLLRLEVTPLGGTGSGAGPGVAGGLAGSGAAVDGLAATLSPSQADGLQALAALGQSIAASAGIDPAQGLEGDHGVGSNDWVVAPAKSATGHALLANDPHLGISMPSVWIMNGLHCSTIGPDCPFDVTGVSFPGDPLVILGHNARIAWGATNLGPDVEDLFIEKADPANPQDYLFKGQSVPFTTRQETIRVAGEQPVTITIRSTGHGPIVSDVDDRLRSLPSLYALRWTATAQPNGDFDAFLALDKAQNFDQFRAAFKTYGAPSQNFVYADVDGNIGYQAPGIIPIRADAHDQGERPVPGDDGLHEWTGSIPFDDLPYLFNPPSGMIVTANNRVVDKDYPYFIANDWDPGYRATRVHELLANDAASGGVTVDEMSAIQTDTKVLRAALVIPALAGARPATADGASVLAAIKGWGEDTCGVDSLGCAAYMTFEEQLERAIFDDDLGSLAREYVGSTESWQAVISLLARPNDRFWDDTTTAGTVETEPTILAEALDRAGSALHESIGANATSWAWGRIHTATFREVTLGESGIGPLEWYFDKGPYPVAGAAGAVDATYYQFSVGYDDPYDPTVKAQTDLQSIFEMTNMPSYRFDIDLGALDGARIVTTTGQSGNPTDAHYGDLIDDWVAGHQVPLPFSPAAVEKAVTVTLTLTP
jgi:penicillin G amidase